MAKLAKFIKQAKKSKTAKSAKSAKLLKIPYMFVIGEKEQNEGLVAVRRQGKGDAGQSPISEIITTLTSEIQQRHSN